MGENLYLSYNTEPLPVQVHLEQAIKYWGNLIDPYKTDHYHLYKKNVLPSSGSSLRDLRVFFLPNIIASEILLLVFLHPSY
ncbi:unnamed protein product [Allacma fusca]|uniref:Uncharacterized protein n=1 Tax=Allacma fusca TaxID=39272 RepID=A0A8J2L3C8_9HEXA|nr:unnamed protein product [Allacma fusca]